MGKPVTLDSDDVECLLVASALARETEARFRAMEDDPQFMRTNGKINEAFARINRTRGDSIRIEEPFDPEVLGSDDWNLLKKLLEVDRQRILSVGSWETLRRFRLVVMGVETITIRWGDKKESVTVDESQGMMYVKLTERGRKLVQTRRSITNANQDN